MSRPVKGNIITRITLETLNEETVFIKQEEILVTDKLERIPLAEPSYLEFPNSNRGRAMLAEVGLDENYHNAIMLIWGNKPTIEDYEDNSN